MEPFLFEDTQVFSEFVNQMKDQAMCFKKSSLTFFTIMIISSVSAYGEQIISDNNVRFIDGNSLIIKGKSVSLYGIQAPVLGSLCGSDKKYDCGLIARSSLMDMSAGATIICDRAPAPHSQDKYKCLSDGYDLSEGMIYTGWAKPLGPAPDLFKKLAREAKARRRGMWRISAK